MAKKRNLALKLDKEPGNETDYTLKGHSCWITVKNLSVYVHKTDEGVVVDIFPQGEEADEPLASTYAFFNEAEDE